MLARAPATQNASNQPFLQHKSRWHRDANAQPSKTPCLRSGTACNIAKNYRTSGFQSRPCPFGFPFVFSSRGPKRLIFYLHFLWASELHTFCKSFPAGRRLFLELLLRIWEKKHPRRSGSSLASEASRPGLFFCELTRRWGVS